MITQCAWCLRIKQPDGTYSQPPTGKLNDASHGMCPDCAEQWLTQVRKDTADAIGS